jgi:hypothetical protein
MARRRFVQIEGELVEVTADYVPSMPVDSGALWGDREYAGMRSPLDGADISTRTKHREYMKAKDITTMDDFKGEWAKAAKAREAIRSGQDTDGRKADLLRAFHKHGFLRG